jgi:hypothetical protein
MKESSLPTPSAIKLSEELLDQFDQSKTFLALPPPPLIFYWRRKMSVMLNIFLDDAFIHSNNPFFGKLPEAYVISDPIVNVMPIILGNGNLHAFDHHLKGPMAMATLAIATSKVFDRHLLKRYLTTTSKAPWQWQP